MANLEIIGFLALAFSPVWLTVLAVYINGKLLEQGTNLFEVLNGDD